MKSLFASGFVLLFTCGVACAGALNATSVSRDIEVHGAKAAVKTLDRMGRFDAVLDHIAAGQSAWIQLAPRLAKGTDAGHSTGLTVALAQALPKNPAAVLAVLDDGPITGTDSVCAAPFIEPAPDEISTYLGSAITAVKSVRGSARLKSKAPCLAALEQIQAESREAQ
jgi:hypothetical protein